MLLQESLVRQRYRRRYRIKVRVLPQAKVLGKVLIKVAKLVIRVLIFVLEAMFDGGRIVREQGPGMRPLEREEFERSYRDAVEFRGKP